MAKNCRLAEAGVDSAVFGRGETPLALIPGLGDGLATVRGKAAALAWACRTLGRARTVYVFSRRDPLPPRWTTRDMARDLAEALASLAEAGDRGALMLDTAARSYSEAYWRAHRWLAPLPGRLGRPRSYGRFLTQARACLSHDVQGRLHVYPALGHAAYEEAPDFQRRILQFLEEELP